MVDALCARLLAQRDMRFEELSTPEEVFVRVYRRLNFAHPTPRFEVRFRQFVGLRSSIHLNQNRAHVHISDILREMKPIVFEALAEILLSKLFRRKPSSEAIACYKAYIRCPAIQQRVDSVRRVRGRKRMLHPRGECYDLEEIFEHLNHQYFEGALEKPRLGWSMARSKTILGHHDPAHGSITITKSLDSNHIPRLLVEYLVFHEMLHILFPILGKGSRRVIHSLEFRKAERRFGHYAEARRLLRAGIHRTSTTAAVAAGVQSARSS